MKAPGVFGRLIAGREWTAVTDGESGSAVFRSGDLFLKHGAGRFARDVVDEHARLIWLDGRIAVPSVEAFAAEGEEAWLVTTALGGRTGDRWIEDAPERVPMVIDAFAGFLRALHALPVDDCPFEAGYRTRLAAARRLVAAGMVDADDFDEDHRGWSAEAVLAKVEALAPPAPERVVTHGDFSLGNLLIDGRGEPTGCIDVGRAGLADPYQDIAILWRNLAEQGAEAQRRFLAGYGVAAADPRRLDFHRCLDELF